MPTVWRRISVPPWLDPARRAGRCHLGADRYRDLIDSKKGTRLRGVPAAGFQNTLRAASLRVTRPRLAVLAAVHGHPHADTDSIIGAVRAELGDVSHQAVYDVLRAL